MWFSLDSYEIFNSHVDFLLEMELSSMYIYKFESILIRYLILSLFLIILHIILIYQFLFNRINNQYIIEYDSIYKLIISGL